MSASCVRNGRRIGELVETVVAEPALAGLRSLASVRSTLFARIDCSIVSEVEFSEEGVLAAAREQTGLSDFGDEGFREGLRVLLETYATTARFSERGRRRNHRRVVQLLANRLKIQAAFARQPEIRERTI